MADNIFSAINNWFRTKNMEAAEAMSNPVGEGKLAIADSESQIAQFTSKIASLIAQTKLFERQLNDSRGDVTKYANVAAAALRAGNEKDARDAISLKQKAEQQAATVQAQLDANNTLVTKLRDQLNTARLKVANARSNITQLEARSSAAKIRTDLAKASTQFSNQGGLAALDNLEHAVNKQETEAEAYEELAVDAGPAGQNLVEKYSIGEGSVEDELARMKQGMLGGGAPTPSLPAGSSNPNLTLPQQSTQER
jgi:phage shock protein A